MCGDNIEGEGRDCVLAPNISFFFVGELKECFWEFCRGISFLYNNLGKKLQNSKNYIKL